MTTSLPFNPMVTTNAPGSFNTSSSGYVQGTALDSPAIRNSLAGGILASSEVIPMWGGVGISETTTPSTGALRPERALGGLITRATNLTAGAANQLTGFSVFDQNYSAVNSPQSQVPMVATYGQVNFYRLGSGARIPVKIDPSLVDLEGNVITQLVSWDFVNQVLQPYVASGATETISSYTWSGGVGTLVMAAPSIYGLGDIVNISGATNSGTGGAGAVNGNFVINTWTDTTHFTIAQPAAAGVIATIGGSPVINVGVGALPVKVLDIQIGNSMTVSYDPVMGFANWDRNGSTAVILI